MHLDGTTFRNKYCVTEGWTGGKVVGYQNLDKLREKAAAFTLRRLKKDVLDLPPKNYIPILVEMNQTQRRIYNRVESEIRTEIETDQGNITVSMFHAITRLTRLLQVADGVVSNGDQVTFLPKRDNAKLRALDDIIDDQLEAKKKTVIWTRYRTAANGILDHMIARGVICARIVGGQTPNARAEEIRRFQEDDDCMVLVGVIQAGGIAITITSAQEAVFYDRWWVHSDNKQAEDRIHRIGTRGAGLVTYLTITAIDTKDDTGPWSISYIVSRAAVCLVCCDRRLRLKFIMISCMSHLVGRALQRPYISWVTVCGVCN